jgi:hypothetical protein
MLDLFANSPSIASGGWSDVASIGAKRGIFTPSLRSDTLCKRASLRRAEIAIRSARKYTLSRLTVAVLLRVISTIVGAYSITVVLSSRLVMRLTRRALYNVLSIGLPARIDGVITTGIPSRKTSTVIDHMRELPKLTGSRVTALIIVLIFCEKKKGQYVARDDVSNERS